MKERGGRLRGWGKSKSGNDVARLVNFRGPIDDFIQIDSINNGQWVGLRKSGETVSPQGEFHDITDVMAISMFFHGGAFHHRNGTASLKVQNFVQGSGPPLNLPFSDIKKAVFASGSAYYLLESGKVEFVSWDGQAIKQSPGWPKLETFFNERNDIIDIDARSRSVAVLTRSGQVYSGDIGKGPNSFSEVRGLPKMTSVMAGGSIFGGLDGKGKVHIWNQTSDEMVPPSDLPPAFAVKEKGNIVAAQLADGSWRAWGNNSTGVVDEINALGPAIDLEFSNDGYVYWIEPASPTNENHDPPSSSPNFPPRLPTSRPGSIKVFRDGSIDNDSPLPGNDFVQVRTSYTGEHIVALTSEGKVVTNDRNLKPIVESINQKQRIRWLGYSTHWPAGGGINEKGEAVSIHVENSGLSPLPEVSEPIIDVKTNYLYDRWGMMLTKSGRVIPWGEVYTREENPWPMPAPEVLTEVIDIAVSSAGGAVLKSNGKILAWNRDGMLDLPSEFGSKITSIAFDYDKLAALSHEGLLHRSNPLHRFDELGSTDQVSKDQRLKNFNQTAFVVKDEAGIWSALKRGEDLAEILSRLSKEDVPEDGFVIFRENQRNGIYWIEPVEK